MFKQMSRIFAALVCALCVQYASAASQIEWLQWFAAEGNSESFYKQLIGEFEKKNPDIKVKLVTVPFGKMRETVVTNSSVGLASDVIGMNMPWTSEFLQIGILEPLDTYLAKDASIGPADLVQAPLGKINGKTWLVPMTGFPFVLHYNRGILKNAGFNAPPKNWEELLAMATKVTDPSKGIYGIGLPYSVQPPANGPVLNLMPLLYTAGGRTLDGVKPDFDNPVVVKTLTYLKRLVDAKAVAPGFASRTGGLDLDEFVAGRTAFLISPSVHTSSIRSGNPKMDYGVAPVPKESHAAYRVHGWELGIGAGSRHKEEAWKLISFLLEKGVNTRVAISSGSLPGNLKAAREMKIEDPAVAMAAKILADQEPVEELRQAPKASASWSVMTEEMQKMLAGKQSPQETAIAVQRRWTQLAAQ